MSLFLVKNVIKISKKLPKKAAKIPVKNPKYAPRFILKFPKIFSDFDASVIEKKAAIGTIKQHVKDFAIGTTCKTPAENPVTKAGKYFFKIIPFLY